MRTSPLSVLLRLVLVGAAVSAGTLAIAAQQPAAGLRIVVIEGEDAVNIIQQKTAVAPVIEVRDRNDQPVAGAIVNFAIRSGRATFGGARTLSVTTNAAGRAVAAGFAPTGSGALQISATAAFQGQTAATITIAQTTVQTAAQAAAVSGAGGAGGSSGGASAGAGAGGGGGLSGTTIGIVGGAAAAGAVVAVKRLGGGTVYRGQFSGTIPMTFSNCTRNEAHTGTLDIEINDDNGSISGTAKVDATVVVTPGTCPVTQASNRTEPLIGFNSASVTGSNGNISFSQTTGNGGTTPDVWTVNYSFTGVLNGAEITGTLTISQEIGGPAGTATNSRGSITHNVTLR